ncbi:dihydropteroate synthase [Tateyamaria omphalii]|uniref:dihydropteroate synthase n=1 Tax=Tateyamaria omphalii TaxID=299262 RepID=UPI001C99862D|nr:dihydropteroate synthase [Tateyamaria omphalii]MBY5933038.1 dihydropteroate synthase [Tateyamaria omphalii]
MRYIRPLMQVGPARPAGAISCGGCWFTDVELLSREAAPQVLPVSELTSDERASFGRAWDAPQIMGILNTTPDSFSDGGQHNVRRDAVAHGQALIGQGARILDIGGESTRPGAQTVGVDEEIARTAPVIRDLRAAGVTTPISIDTRKAAVAEAALDAGASIVNDVSGFTYDPDLAPLCAARGVPVCVMHAQGDPQTMQDNPTYDDVLLDVYDFLAERIEMLQAAGIAKDRIIADPGIGFGKTLDHNLALLNRISLFHSLGVPILLGASRKRFIGTLGNAPDASARAPGSVAVALAAIAQGVQIIRAHDVAEHAQAIALWRASVAHR